MTHRQRKSDAEQYLASLYKLLLTSPAWAGPVFAAVVFVLFRYLVPAMSPANERSAAGVIAALSKVAAPFAALAVIITWLLAEAQKFRQRRRFDRLHGLDDVRALSWKEFEVCIAEYYRRKGYAAEIVGGGGADGGVDVLLHNAGRKTLVQCKQWKSWKVGVRTVRELYGVMASEGVACGVLVCSGLFTKEALAFAAGKPLELIDGEALAGMIASTRTERRPVVGVSVESATRPRKRPVSAPHADPTSREAIGGDVTGGGAIARDATSSEVGSGDVTAREATAPEATSGDSMAARPDERERPEGPPVCPRCGAAMILRTARRGAHTGSEFYGCSNYPKCRGTREASVS